MGSHPHSRRSSYGSRSDRPRFIVTGASRGIGKAIVEALAGEGAHVAICARGAGPLAELIEALSEAGHTAFGSTLDVTDDAACRSWIKGGGDQPRRPRRSREQRVGSGAQPGARQVARYLRDRPAAARSHRRTGFAPSPRRRVGGVHVVDCGDADPPPKRSGRTVR